jgi:hypothetical protein
MRSFKSLSEQDILALAISLEEEDARIYDDFADGLQANHPASAQKFKEMRAEEDGHRHRTFRVGLAASVGAGISIGFAEALSDDGSLTGRGRPLTRGIVCGLMTTVGGLGHTMPYLIRDYKTATGVAVGVVLVELGVIAWIRNHFMDTPLTSAAFQVVIGGLLVFLARILIGSS